jgi:hypothetical protein
MASILDLLPNYYHNIYDYRELATIEDDQDTKFIEWLGKRIKNLYATQADEDGITNFEQEYHIQHDSNDTLDTRRRRVLSVLLPPQVITKVSFQEILKALGIDIYFDANQYNLTSFVECEWSDFPGDRIKELNDILRRYIPANIDNHILRQQHARTGYNRTITTIARGRMHSHASFDRTQHAVTRMNTVSTSIVRGRMHAHADYDRVQHAVTKLNTSTTSIIRGRMHSHADYRKDD